MSVPLTFANSFWSPDFNLDPLWAKLRAGVAENQEVLRFISDRAGVEGAAARSLYDASEVRLNKSGFGHDDGASLRRTYEGLRAETHQSAKAHETVAKNLDMMVLRPFSTWSHAHEGRVADLKSQLDETIVDWQGLSAEVRKLKDNRNIKCRALEEAGDDLRFAPTSPSSASPAVPAKAESSTSSSSRARSDSGSAAQAYAAAAAKETADRAALVSQQASMAATNLARNFSQRMKVSPTANAVKARFERMRLEAKEREAMAKGDQTGTIPEEQEDLVDEEGASLKDQEKKEVLEKQKGTGLLGAPFSQQHKRTQSGKLKIEELEIAGIVKHPKDWSIIFSKAKLQVPTTAVKVPLLGTTPDASSGEDLVLWFRDNLDDLGGSLSRSHEFCRQLAEELSILRLVGELGSRFFDSSDSFYAWRPDAFHLEELQSQINEAENADTASSPLLVGGGTSGEKEPPLTNLPAPTHARKISSSPLMSPRMQPMSPPGVPDKEGAPSPRTPSSSIIASVTPGSASSSSGLTRSNTLSSYLSSAYEKAASNVSVLNAKMAARAGGHEGRLDRLRKDADEQEIAYRTAVRELDDLRMHLEELHSSTLSRAQKLEFDRLKAVKSVLTTFNSIVASLNMPLQLAAERSALLTESFVPLSDLNSVIERYRTGSFRPKPAVWLDWYNEQTDVRFGVDLRHWRDITEKEVQVPDVWQTLLDILAQGYPNLPSDEERRKTWIYEVPLQYTHRLRNMVNIAASPLATEDLKRFDLPVLASAVKLYLLETATAIVPQALYGDLKAVYPTIGAAASDEDTKHAAILALLERLPKIHLVVLDRLLSHLTDLLSSTKASESETDDQYIGKLGATLGPCIVRPAVDSSKTFNDRFPSLFFADLLKHRQTLMVPTLEKKAKIEEERYAPKRKRTKAIDERLNRSSLASELDDETKRDLLRQEFQKKHGTNVMEEPAELPEKEEVPPPPAKSEEAGNDESSEEDKKEELQIPPPPAAADEEPSNTGSQAIHDQAASSGAPPPAEQDYDQSTAPAAAGQPEEAAESTSAAIAPLDLPSQHPSEADDLDSDKPLFAPSAGALAGLNRSSTGSSAKRAPPSRSGAIGGGSGKARGPRPMSMQYTSSSGGIAGSPTAGSGEKLERVVSPPGSASGVRARAAMFEQQGK